MDDDPSVEANPAVDRPSGGWTDHEDGVEWRLLAQRMYDPAGGADLTTTIVETVAEASDADILDVSSPPLYDVVDVDAIERCFFTPVPTRLTRSKFLDGSVRFAYLDYRIVVDSDGWITVQGSTAQVHDE